MYSTSKGRLCAGNIADEGIGERRPSDPLNRACCTTSLERLCATSSPSAAVLLLCIKKEYEERGISGKKKGREKETQR